MRSNMTDKYPETEWGINGSEYLKAATDISLLIHNVI